MKYNKACVEVLCGTIECGLKYASYDGVKLVGFTYLDWARSAVDRKSTSECCFCLGSTMVSWINKKQTSRALSTSEAEYITTNVASKEAMWLQKLLANLYGHELDVTMIFCDNESYMKLLENFMFHDTSKHIDLRYHYIRNIVQKGVVKLQYISTNEQTADILTKSLSRVEIAYFYERVGVVEIPFLGKGD